MSKIFKNNKGKVCGYLIDDKIYRKKVDSVKHKLRVANAYGIDRNIVTELRELGCIEIRILETDTKKILSCSFDDFDSISFCRDLDGEQLFLPMNYWDISEYKG